LFFSYIPALAFSLSSLLFTLK